MLSWQNQRVIPACVPQRPNSAGTLLRWKRTSTGCCLRCSSKRAASTSLGWPTLIRHCRTRPPSPFWNAGELASIAKRCNVRIVEDDRYWLLADAPPPPIATFAPEQVYYISTLSKCLTLGLRVAFVLIRAAHERERFLVALRSFPLMVAPLTAALATQWILDGSADGLMEGVRNKARLRHRMVRDILAGRYSGA